MKSYLINKRGQSSHNPKMYRYPIWQNFYRGTCCLCISRQHGIKIKNNLGYKLNSPSPCLKLSILLGFSTFSYIFFLQQVKQDHEFTWCSWGLSKYLMHTFILEMKKLQPNFFFKKLIWSILNWKICRVVIRNIHLSYLLILWFIYFTINH